MRYFLLSLLLTPAFCQTRVSIDQLRGSLSQVQVKLAGHPQRGTRISVQQIRGHLILLPPVTPRPTNDPAIQNWDPSLCLVPESGVYVPLCFTTGYPFLLLLMQDAPISSH